MDLTAATIILLLIIFALVIQRKAIKSRRERMIDSYYFPEKIRAKIMENYPHLSIADSHKVIKALREYFHVCNLAGRRMVAMPSQVVDVAWHEFILFTRKYDQFCHSAFGRFLHHTPAEAMTSRMLAQDGIKRAWKISCLRENITPKDAKKMPLLFAIDADLDIPNGFKYSLDCTKNDNYCASHIGCGGCGGGCSSSDCGGGCGGD